MNRLRRLATFAAVAFVAAAPVAAHAQAALDEVMSKKLIRMAIPTD
jgi:hypothetical protein